MDYFFLKTLFWETAGSPQESCSAIIFFMAEISVRPEQTVFENLNSVF